MTKILFFLIMGIFGSNREANYDLISLCRVSNDTIMVDYIDSMHGIKEIKQTLKGDTLELRVFISLNKKHKEFTIPIKSDLKFVMVGKRKVETEKLETCPKVYSGEDALEHLKRLKNK